MWRLATALVVVLRAGAAAGQPSPAATTILCESHAGTRPARADEYLEAVRAGLGAPVPVHGGGLDALVDERVSRPAGTADYPLLGVVRNHVIDAQEDVVRARFADAVARMERLRATVAQHAAAVAANPRIRKSLFEGTLAMLKALIRLRRQGDAESLAIEMSRSFPDYVATEREYGPEVVEFIGRVRRQSFPRGRHAITVETSPAGAAVFLNERYVGTSPLKVPDVIPGRYRVMARMGETQSRVHVATVLEESVDVRIDLAFDEALGPAGFRFASDADRAHREAPYALRLARALGATEVIAVGLAGPPERPLWVATVYNVESGGILRSAAVALGPTPPPRELVVALGRFLRAGAPAAGLIVQQNRDAKTAGPLADVAFGAAPARAPGRTLRVLSYVGFAGAAALVGVGAYLLHLDGAGTCDLQPGQVRCPEVHHTFGGGVGAVAGGAALGAVSATLLYLDLRRARVHVALGRGSAPVALWVQGVF